LTPRVFKRRCTSWFGRGDSGIRHRIQNSIRLASRSTEGRMTSGVFAELVLGYW
jgi:hypothetical protein